MIYKDVKSVFKTFLPHIKFDKKFLSVLTAFRLNWLNKNPDHIEFLGGNLVGVNKIIFSNLDEETIFVDILKVDVNELKKALHSVKEIEPSRIVTSNVFYHTMVYLMHGFITSKEIGKDKDLAVKECYYIFSYRVFSSLLNWYFKYPLEKDIALAVYERLSNRYLIKKLNNWQEVLDYRANDFLKGGLHYQRLIRYTTDDALRIIMDAQGRIRDNLKNIYAVIIEVKEDGDSIKTTNLEESIEDSNGLKDITNRPDVYVSYIQDIISKPNDFYKDDLVHVIDNLLSNLDVNPLKQTLYFMSENAMDKSLKIYKLIDIIIKESINYINSKGLLGEFEKDLENILKMIRGYWSSSKVNNKNIKMAKKALQVITKKATGKKTQWILVTTAIGIVLYIFLRAMAKNTYK